MTKINQTERACRAWDVLAEIACQSEMITYGQLGAAIGIHHRAIRYVLGPIQDYCLEEKLPPLTILVNNTAGVPGSGFIAHDREDLGNGLEAVWAHDWKAMQNPFDFASDGKSFQSLVNDLANRPEDGAEIYAFVKTRGLRHLLFKSAVFKAYSSKCAFSGIEFSEVLEAAHIVPWSISTPQQRMDVRNGIVLSALHHKLFDKGLITIGTDYEIRYFDADESVRDYSMIERSLTVALHGNKILLPRLLKHRPLVENIEQHHRILGWTF